MKPLLGLIATGFMPARPGAAPGLPGPKPPTSRVRGGVGVLAPAGQPAKPVGWTSASGRCEGPFRVAGIRQRLVDRLQAAADFRTPVFTTGHGTPCGPAAVPVIKVATRSDLARRWHVLMDVNASILPVEPAAPTAEQLAPA